MATHTLIEWAANADGSPGATWNPIRARTVDAAGREKIGWHCQKVSAGCTHCYAENWNKRFGTGLRYAPQETEDRGGDVSIFLGERMLTAPLRRTKPTTYFLSSMTDVFADFVPDDMIDKLWAVMALSPQHTFIVVTKRAQRMHDYFAETWQTPACEAFHVAGVDVPARAAGVDTRWDIIRAAFTDVMDLPSGEIVLKTSRFWTPEGSLINGLSWPHAPLPNVWLLVSVEDQPSADERIPLLLATPAAVRGISAEPLLGPVDLDSAWHGESALNAECWGDCAWCTRGHPPLHNCSRGRQAGAHLDKGRSGLDWVIVGGESGTAARPMHPDWARSLRDQCAAAGVPFFFKQWGEWIAGEVFAHGNSLGLAIHQDGEAHPGKLSHWWSGDVAGGVISTAIGKKKSGRLLDGREHNERPKL